VVKGKVPKANGMQQVNLQSQNPKNQKGRGKKIFPKKKWKLLGTVNLSDFYSYRLIGKLTAFLQLQEFSQRNQTWELRTSTFAARLCLRCSNLGLEI
jgi:hypothetical protein